MTEVINQHLDALKEEYRILLNSGTVNNVFVSKYNMDNSNGFRATGTLLVDFHINGEKTEHIGIDFEAALSLNTDHDYYNHINLIYHSGNNGRSVVFKEMMNWTYNKTDKAYYGVTFEASKKIFDRLLKALNLIRETMIFDKLF